MTNSANTNLSWSLLTKKIARLQLDHITLDDRLQSRDLNLAVVKDYVEALRRGEEFPPVRVVHAEDNYYLVDGHHRLAARRELHGVETIDAEIVEGSFSDALWFSWGANREHGLRRTQEDKRRAVRAALEHPRWNRKSNREIARHIGCDHKTVAAIRRSGEFPKDEATRRRAHRDPGPSKKEILRASRVLAKVRTEQARGFSKAEFAIVLAGHDPLYRFLFGAGTLKPRNPNQAEAGSEESRGGMNVECRAN